MKRKLLYIIIILLSWACTYEFPYTEVIDDNGSADFSKFVCIGDNYTSGFMDGALFREGQINSVGSMLARQVSDTTGENLVQATIANENGYNYFLSDTANVYGKLIRTYTSLSDNDPIIIALPGELPTDYTGDKNLLTDFSIPFLKSYQFDQAALSSNLYYNRISADPGSSTLISQISSSSPSFFVLWEGMYDALHYSVSGAMGDANPPSDPDLLNDLDLTPEDVFENSIRQMISTLLSNPHTKGVVVNLPSFDDLPFFYFYQYDFITLAGSEKGVAQQFYNEFNQAVTLHNQIPGNEPRPYISFNDNGETLYPQPIVVIDNLLPDGVDLYGDPLPKYRQLQPGEMVLLSLPFDQVEDGLGTIIPIEKMYYLNSIEISNLRQTIERYNEILSEIVNENSDRLALADINTPIKELAATGRVDSWGIPDSFQHFYQNGLPIEANLSMNSIFSLDGLHFNQRGNAYVANLIIAATNNHFGSNISFIDINQYIGNTIVLDY